VLSTTVCSVKEFVGERLPVGNGGIENLIADVAYQFRDQSFLHLRELQVGIIGCCGRELSFPALVGFAVFKTNIHRDAELHLRRITIGRNRFVELQKKVVVKLAILLKMFCLGKCAGISYIDSTPIRVCHIKREKQHKVFKGFAQKGQCSLGWFYGFKLHLIINDKGEILDFIITPGNVNDRKPLNDMDLHKRIFGKLYGDKGYISKDLFEKLFVDGVHLITKIKKNMKNSLILLQDKIALRKRALIETVNDELKNICQIEHTRHRSFENFTTNLLSGLIAYSFFDKKPSINLQEDIIDMKRLAA